MQAKSPRVAAVLFNAAAIFLAIAAAGCSSPPDPIERMAPAMQACIDLMRPITDAASAQAAIGEIKPTFEEVGSAMTDIVALAQNSKAVLANLDEIQRLQNDMMRLEGQLNAEIDRLTGLKGLPVEFWNVFRVETNRLGKTLVEAAAAGNPSADQSVVAAVVQSASMYEQHPPERIVEFELINASGGDSEAAVERIRAMAGGGAQVVSLSDPKDYDLVHVTVAPVDDFDKLVAAVDFGTVVDSEKAKGTATVELSNLAAENDEVAVAEAPDGPVAAADDVAARDDVAAVEAPAEVAGDSTYAESTVADLGRPPAVPEGYENRGAVYPPTDPSGRPPLEQTAEAPGDQELTGAQLFMLRAKTALSGMLGASGATPPGGDGAGLVIGDPTVPQPGSPTYHAQLAELLFDAQSPHHEMAVLELLKVPPKSVPDKKLRGRIAKGYQHVAFETGAHVAEAVEGLVIWGGKFSAPLLIQLLNGGNSADAPASGDDMEEPGRGAVENLGRPDAEYMGRGGGGGGIADDAIIAALGKLATPEAAAAVAGRLGEASVNSETAFASLRAMGPVAETALLKVLPFEAPEANRSAIELLGDIGTKKCVAMLRRATQSENPEVADAALEAIRKIQQRDRASRKPG